MYSNYNRFFRIRLAWLVTGLFLSVPGFAQTGGEIKTVDTPAKETKSSTFQRWTLTPKVGATIPFLDVKSSISPAFGLSFRFALTHAVSLELEGVKSWMNSSNSDKYKREFKNSFMAYSGRVVYSFYNVGGFRQFLPGFSPYISVGIGQMFNDVSAVKTGTSNVRNSQPNKSTVLALPIGAGIKFFLGSHFDLSLQGDYYLTKNDILDGFQPSVNGNFFQDRFLTVLLGLSYKFGKGSENLEWYDYEQVLKDKIKSSESKLLSMETRLLDSDRDGVIDELDQEPNTPEGVRVDTKGVTMDTDYDGLKDDVDKCPGIPGPIENNGCPYEKKNETPNLDGKYVKDSDENRLNPDEVSTTRNIINDPKNSKYKNNPSNTTEKIKDKHKKNRKEDSGNADLDNYPIYKIDLNETVGPNDSTFYIIGGSFVKKYNAVRFSKKVNKLGLSSKVLYFEAAGLYRVTFHEYRSREKCLEELKKIRETVDNDAWLFAH